MHDIRYNEVNDEIIVPNPFANAILIFKGGANGQEAPIRVIQGPKTQLDGPDRMDIDTVHREIFVPDGGSVFVYPLDANGDTAPLRTIRGGPSDRTVLMIDNPRAVGYDKKRQEILVPN